MSLQTFIPQRFRTLLQYLEHNGLAIVDGRERSRWEDRTHYEPPYGYIHIKATVLPEPPELPQAWLELSERWTSDQEHPYAQQRTDEPLWLDAFAYHFAVNGQQWRYDLDYQRHPEQPYHQHQVTDPDLRLAWTPNTGDITHQLPIELWQAVHDALQSPS